MDAARQVDRPTRDQATISGEFVALQNRPIKLDAFEAATVATVFGFTIPHAYSVPICVQDVLM